MTQTTRDNHFVPQWYLKQWCNAAGLVWSYRLLVSHRSVPPWQQVRPRSVAFHKDLYTAVSDDKESDDFERRLEREFEAPAQVALQRVLDDQPLRAHHWQHLGRYALCQQLRTPQDFIESMARGEKVFPDLIDQTLRRAVQKLEESHRTGQPLSTPEPVLDSRSHFQDAVRVIVRPDAHPETNEGEIGAEIQLGRSLWLGQQQHLLNGVGWIAALHSWSIAEPAGGAVWFTSDQPVVRLNYTDGNFNLNGGWGRPKGDILMPLSPRHLLFTEVGEELPPRIVFDKERTEVIQKALALRAHRVVFADRRLKPIEALRPRTVDAIAFQRESETWARWHKIQTDAQREFHGGATSGSQHEKAPDSP